MLLTRSPELGDSSSLDSFQSINSPWSSRNISFPLLPLSEKGRAKLSLAYEDIAFLDSLSTIKLKSQYFFSPVVFT